MNNPKYQELRDKLRLKSANNRFLSTDLTERDKILLYQHNRVYDMDKFKQVLSSKTFSPYKSPVKPKAEQERNQLKTSQGMKRSSVDGKIATPGSLVYNNSQGDLMNTKRDVIKTSKARMMKTSSSQNFYRTATTTLNNMDYDRMHNYLQEEDLETNTNTFLKLTSTEQRNYAEIFNTTFKEKKLNTQEELAEMDKDMETLLEQYKFSDARDDAVKMNNFLKKKTGNTSTNLKNELSNKQDQEQYLKKVKEKYRLNSHLNKLQLVDIELVLKDRGVVHNNKIVGGKKQITAVTLKERDFDNPYVSAEILKKNSSIYNNIMNIRTEKQINCFKERYMEKKKLEDDLLRMPNVKITNIKRKKKEKEDEDLNISHEEEKPVIRERSSIKTIKLSRETVLQNTLDLPCYFIKKMNSMPSSRCFTSFTINENKEGEAFLFAGGNCTKLLDIWRLNLSDGSLGETVYKWKKIIPKMTEHIYPRWGHSAVFFDKLLLFFGGMTDYDVVESELHRDDLLVYDIVNNNLYAEKCYQKNDLKWRRNHIAEIIGNHMLIYGGVDEKGVYLSDMWILDLFNFIWLKIEPKQNIKTPAIAYHASVMAFSSEKREHPNFKIFSFADLVLPKSAKKVKNDGLYVFGGMDESRLMINEMKYLKLGKKPIEWIVPKADGIRPNPRICPSMNFYEELGIIVLHGGSDRDKRIFYKDLFIFDLEKFVWTKINLFNGIPKERSEHCSIITNNKLIVFGGSNSDEYIGSELFIINFDVNDNKYQLYSDKSKGVDEQTINANSGTSLGKSNKALLKKGIFGTSKSILKVPEVNANNNQLKENNRLEDAKMQFEKRASYFAVDTNKFKETLKMSRSISKMIRTDSIKNNEN